jgi:NAD(P)-dependent dehydrogenase (short-subunit alcohol dehydrogenase family)
VEQAIKKLSSHIRVHKFSLDITDEAKVLTVAEAVKKEEGRPDILINNAGTGDPWKPITEGIADDYWRTMTVNLKGPYLLMKSFLPLMVETAKTTGTIVDVVNISSIGATVVIPGASSYQISKLAVTRLTEFVQVEYGAQGVNCVAVHPGGVLTDLSKNMPPPFLASESTPISLPRHILIVDNTHVMRDSPGRHS